MTWQLKLTNLNLIHAISFMDFFAIGLTIPIFNNHLRQLGASHLTVGLLNSLHSGIQIISGPLIGSWSDVRDRKSVLIITLILCSISNALLGLTESMLPIFLLRFILGIVEHTQSITKAVITDLLPPKERAGAFGRSDAFGLIGFIVGPIISGHVSELQNGFCYVCFLTAILAIVNIGLAAQLELSKKSKTTSHEKNGIILGKMKQEFSKIVNEITEINWAIHWECFLVRFIYGFAFTMYISNQSMYLREYFNLSPRHMSYVMSYFATIATISAFLLDQFNKLFYKDDEDCMKRLRHFFSLMTISIVCLYFSSNIQLFLLFLMPFCICSTILSVVSMELMLKQSETENKEHKGSFTGASNSVMSLARFITPVTSGVISDIFGEHLSLLLTTIPALIGTVICFKMGDKKDCDKKLREESLDTNKPITDRMKVD